MKKALRALSLLLVLLLALPAFTMAEDGLTVPESSSGFWSIVMIGVIPAVLLCAGVIIYIRRKRR